MDAIRDTFLRNDMLNFKVKVWFRGFSFSKQVIFRFQMVIFQGVIAVDFLDIDRTEMVSKIQRWSKF